MGGHLRWPASSRTRHTRARALLLPAGPFGTPSQRSIALLRWAARLGPQRSSRRPNAGVLARWPEQALRAAGPRAPAHGLRGAGIGEAPRALSRRRSAASPAAPHAPSRWPAAGPRVLFPMAPRPRTLVSNDSLEQTGRPAALPRPELRPGRPAAQAHALDAQRLRNCFGLFTCSAELSSTTLATREGESCAATLRPELA